MTRTEDLLCFKSNVQNLRQGKNLKTKKINVITAEFVTETLDVWEPRRRLCVGACLAWSGSLPGFTEEGSSVNSIFMRICYWIIDEWTVHTHAPNDET